MIKLTETRNINFQKIILKHDKYVTESRRTMFRHCVTKLIFYGRGDDGFNKKNKIALQHEVIG